MAWLAGTALAGLAIVYAFVVVVDPWDVLPLSPPWPRGPISTNARFSFPALARSAQFDSAIFGTSTSRMLRPAVLNALFDARFVNLAMNSATAWEQSRMLAVFVRAHPQPHVVLVGLDAAWCARAPAVTSGRPFPGWMYDGSPWRGYREVATLYAVQEAANQFAVLTGLKRRRYGLDGYTSFLPDEARYDAAKVAATFQQWGPAPNEPAVPVALPALALLQAGLAGLPAATHKLLVFMPSAISLHGVPGSDAALLLAACKRAVAELAGAIPGSLVVDFQVDSAITASRDNYWDPLHYRIGIAERIMAELADAAAGRAVADGQVLRPSPR